MLRLKDAIDEKTLVIIQRMFMQFLHSSAAMYEADGTYLHSTFEGEYCSYLNDVSCRNSGECEEESLCSGKWICHEDCLRISIESMNKKEPVEIECSGGIHIYAVPIVYKDRVIGSINAAVTNPPLESEKLESISKLYGIDVDELTQRAYSYKRLINEEMEIARMQIRMAALLISSLYDAKVKQVQAEEEVKRQKEQLEVIMENMTEGMFIFDGLGSIFLLIRLAGNALEEMLKKTEKVMNL